MILLALGCARREPATAAQPLVTSFRFAVVGDRTDEPNDVAWRRILAQVEALRPDLVLTVGDLADDALDPTDWDQALAATDVLTAPIEFTPGNHDIVDEATAEVFTDRTGQAPYRSFEWSGMHFVIVDNAIAESWEALAEAQRTWLEADLAAHAGEPIAVFMHKPFWATRAALGKPDPMHDLFVRSGVRAVFTGHWHNHSHQVVDGIDYTIVGSSGGAFAGLPDDRLGNTYEFLWVTVRDGELTISTVASGGVYPVDAVSLADAQRVRALRMGALTATITDDALALRVENLSDQAIDQVLTVEPGAWTVSAREVPVVLAPGAVFETSLSVKSPSELYPLPRIRLPYPLPDAGLVPFGAVVEHRRRIEVPRGRPPTVDGTLAEGEWAGAATVSRFTTGRGLPATGDPTTLYLRYDDQALYVGARCEDAEPAAIQHLHQGRDGHVVYDDRIGLLLAPSPEQVYWFYVNPNGAVWDLHADRAAKVVDRDWNGVEAAATIDAGGWSVEARVPFAALGLEAPPASWGFDMRRRQERLQTEAVFTPGFGTTVPGRIGVMTLVP